MSQFAVRAAKLLREVARERWDRYARGECSWRTVLAAIARADECAQLLTKRERAEHHRWLFEQPMTETVAA